MSTEYSKPSDDVAIESQRLLENDADELRRQQVTSARLAGPAKRSGCVICRRDLDGPLRFLHRSVEYVRCSCCGHVQTANQPPDGYPHRSAEGLEFDDVYPELNQSDYASRRDRIYQPKLDWVMRQLMADGLSEKQILERKWLEVGPGAGYFLDSLRRRGAERISGLEQNRHLASRANAILGEGTVRSLDGPLADAIRASGASVIVAFFVLEHLDDPRSFWDAMAAMTPGTALVFSVPCFGFSALLESACDSHAARCLDNVFHTQLYTDESIAFALRYAGMRNVGAWHFGQDAADLRRLLMVRLTSLYSPALLADVGQSLAGIVDHLQATIDRSHLSDERHIVAIKA